MAKTHRVPPLMWALPGFVIQMGALSSGQPVMAFVGSVLLVAGLAYYIKCGEFCQCSGYVFLASFVRSYYNGDGIVRAGAFVLQCTGNADVVIAENSAVFREHAWFVFGHQADIESACQVFNVVYLGIIHCNSTNSRYVYKRVKRRSNRI